MPSTTGAKGAIGSGALLRSMVMGAGAVLLFGSWAYFANAEHGVGPAIRAAVIQGAASFISTMFMFLLVEWTYARIDRRPLRIVMAGVAAPGSMLSLVALTHVLVGTPDVAQTLLPSCIAGVSSATLYSLRLDRANARANTSNEGKGAETSDAKADHTPQ